MALWLLIVVVVVVLVLAVGVVLLEMMMVVVGVVMGMIDEHVATSVEGVCCTKARDAVYVRPSRSYVVCGLLQEALFRKIVRGKPLMSPAGEKYSSHLVDILNRCMSQQPEQRPDTLRLLAEPHVRNKARELKIELPDPRYHAITFHARCR